MEEQFNSLRVQNYFLLDRLTKAETEIASLKQDYKDDMAKLIRDYKFDIKELKNEYMSLSNKVVYNEEMLHDSMHHACPHMEE